MSYGKGKEKSLMIWRCGLKGDNGYSLAVSGDKKHNTFSQHKRKLNERN